MQHLHGEGLVCDDVRVHDEHLEAGPVARSEPFEQRRAAEPTSYVTPHRHRLTGTCLYVLGCTCQALLIINIQDKYKSPLV